MKYALALAAVGTLVAAQDFPGVPSCAIPCLVTGIPLVGCQLTDNACLCSPDKQASLEANPTVIGCLTSNCQPADLVAAQSAAASDCSAFLATAGPTGASSTGSASATTGSASGSGATQSATSSAGSSSSESSAATTKAPSATASTSAPSSVSTGAAGLIGVSGALAVFLGAIAAL